MENYFWLRVYLDSLYECKFKFLLHQKYFHGKFEKWFGSVGRAFNLKQDAFWWWDSILGSQGSELWGPDSYAKGLLEIVPGTTPVKWRKQDWAEGGLNADTGAIGNLTLMLWGARELRWSQTDA